MSSNSVYSTGGDISSDETEDDGDDTPIEDDPPHEPIED